MNRKTIVHLGFLAAGSVILFAVLPNNGSILLLMSLPFTLIGKGLRALSLSGTAGNCAAIVIYAAICLLPLAALFKKKAHGEDWLLAVESAALFYVLYLMINPGRMKGMGGDTGSVIYSGVVYSVFISWAIFKLLRREERLDKEGGYRALRILLGVCGAISIVAGFGIGVGDLKAEIAEVHAGNTMPGQNLMVTDLFLFLAFAVRALEYSLDAGMMLYGVELLRELEQDAYSQRCVDLAGTISRKSRVYLIIVLLSSMALNLAQVVWASRLYTIHTTVRIPVFSAALCFGSMALTRLLGQGKGLKEENDLYI